MTGDLGKSEHVEYLKVPFIEASSTFEMIANIDGDEGNKLPIKVENLNRHLEIFVPKEQ